MNRVTLNRVKRHTQSLCCAGCLVMALGGGVAFSVEAATHQQDEWRPVASEQLIKLPPKYIENHIESDFRQSPLASQINALDTQIQMEVSRMGELKTAIEEVTGDQSVELRHQLLQAKTNYLDLMQEKQALKESELEKKAQVYQNVLDKLARDRNRAKDPVSAKVMAAQQAARARLDKNLEDIDEIMMVSMPGKSSQYQQDYRANLAKMEQLQQSIAQHPANENPNVDGVDMNREQYMRFLLSNAEGQLAVLDQEKLMVGYMAKLVSLDAQALEHEITTGAMDADAVAAKEQIRVINTADLFMN